MQVFDDEFDYREIVNWQELTDMAVALFVGLTALDTVSTGAAEAVRPTMTTGATARTRTRLNAPADVPAQPPPASAKP